MNALYENKKLPTLRKYIKTHGKVSSTLEISFNEDDSFQFNHSLNQFPSELQGKMLVEETLTKLEDYFHSNEEELIKKQKLLNIQLKTYLKSLSLKDKINLFK